MFVSTNTGTILAAIQAKQGVAVAYSMLLFIIDFASAQQIVAGKTVFGKKLRHSERIYLTCCSWVALVFINTGSTVLTIVKLAGYVSVLFS